MKSYLEKIQELEKAKVIPIALLIFIAALSSLSSTVISPSLLSISAELGIASHELPLIMTGYFFSFSFGQLFTGNLADRFGRRKVLLFSLILYALASFWCGFSGSFNALLLGRISQGFAAGMFVVIYRVVVYDLYQGEKANQIFAYLSAVFTFVIMFAPLLGGFFEQNFNWHISFYFLFSMSFLFGLLSFFNFKETLPNLVKPENNDWSGFLKNYYTASKLLLQSPLFLFYTSMLTLVYTCLLILIASLPNMVAVFLPEEAAKIPQFFVIMIIGYMLGNFLNGRFANKIKRGWLYTLSHGLIFMGPVIAFFTGYGMDTVAFAAILSVICIGLGVLFPYFMANIVNSFPENRGSAAALAGFFQTFLASVLVSLMGFWLDPGMGSFVGVLLFGLCSYLIYFIFARFIR